MAGYDVYLGSTLFPVAPDKINMRVNGKNTTYDLINDGEMNILKLAGLTTVSFSVLLPAVQYPFAVYPNRFKAPSYYLDRLAELKQSKKAFQFIVTRKDTMKGRMKLHNTNMTVSLEDYSIKDDAGEGFDVKVEINLKQYKEFKTKTFKVTTPAPTAPIAVTPARPTTTTPTPGGGGGGGSGKKYKVQIPGMGVVEVYATSAQAAITKASGSTWTGTIYVDGQTYYVTKGKITKTPEQLKAEANAKKVVTGITKVVTTVVDKVKTGLQALGDGLKNLFGLKQKETKTTVTKPALSNSNNNKIIMKLKS